MADEDTTLLATELQLGQDTAKHSARTVGFIHCTIRWIYLRVSIIVRCLTGWLCEVAGLITMVLFTWGLPWHSNLVYQRLACAILEVHGSQPF